jgi:hypothetical protein
MKEIKIVRLSSGEELLCKYDGEIVYEPVVIIPAGDGKISFYPYMPYADVAELKITQRSIMFVVDPIPEMVEKYKMQIGEIIMPNPGIIS